MKLAHKLNSDVDKQGVWGPVTATLDWCEDNYVSSPYVAELWNTISNLAMILPPLLGLWHLHKLGAERRFSMCLFTLLIVGLGSSLFHATLSHSMQLVDELSMLFTTSVLLYVVKESRSPFKSSNAPLAGGLLATCLFVSAAYILVNHPLFHQLAYAVMVAFVVIGAGLVVREHPEYVRLFVFSVSMYLVGFIFWEIDVHGCSHLRAVRSEWSKNIALTAFAGLTQFHAWWHVLAGLGTYGHIVALCSTRSLIVGQPHGVGYLCGLLPIPTRDRSPASAGKKL